MTYTNWITGRKSNYVRHTVEDCVTFLPHNQGKWDDICECIAFTGDQVTYTNWIPNKKSNYVSHTVEDCVTFLPYNQGKWDEIPCETRVNVLLLQVIR